jgi:hypothetical protein
VLRIGSAIFAAAVLAHAAGAATAHAGPPPPGDGDHPTGRAAAAKVTVTPDVVPRGERIAIRGRGWAPGSRVKLSIGLPESDSYPIATLRANARGRFVKRVRMRGLPGLYVVVACPPGRCARPARTGVRVVAADTGTRTLLHSDRPRSRYLERPRAVGYDSYTTAAAVSSVGLSRLAWRRWGKGRATATGRARVCAEGGGCRTVDARIAATRRVRYESAEWFYARVVVRLLADAGIEPRRLVLCTLPGICGGRPGPP